MKVAFRLLPYFYFLLAAFVLLALVSVLLSISALFQENFHPAARERELAAMILLFLVGAGLLAVYVVNAIFLLKRIKRKNSLILSLISCIGFPLGTILGTISLFLLTRSEIRAEYE
jgi:hypothetical protein